MAIEKSTKFLVALGSGAVVIFVIFISIGIWCLGQLDPVIVTKNTTYKTEYMRVGICKDSEVENLFCNALKPSQPPFPRQCDCDFPISVPEDLKGTVTLYYELPQFDQTRADYVSSKDDNQLSGKIKIGDLPSETCGNFSHNGNTSIFPCGEIADSLFNDTFALLYGKETVPVEYTDLLPKETTSKYRNPPADVVKNFSSPINWLDSGVRPWESYPGALKDVENPRFQAWMDTGLKRKPVWRIQRAGRYSEGLPAGNYTLSIVMHYGVDRYDGERCIILEGVETKTIPGGIRNYGWGVALVVLAVAVVAFVAGYIFMQWRENSSKNTDGTTQVTQPLRQRISNTIQNLRR